MNASKWILTLRLAQKIWNSLKNTKQYLKENPELCAEIEAKVRTHFGLEGAGKNDEKEKKETAKDTAEGKKSSKASEPKE